MIGPDGQKIDSAPEQKIRIDHTQLKLNWKRQNFRDEVRNAHINYQFLQEGHKKGTVVDSFDLPKVDGQKACLVIGSGSSLNDYLEKMIEWTGDIICSTSHISTLVYNGRAPNYALGVDPRFAADHEFRFPHAEQLKNTTFVSHPGGPPTYFKRWPSKIALFGLMDSSEPYYLTVQRIAYDWIRGFFVPLADAVSAELALAMSLGYHPIYLIGVDYGGDRFTAKFWNDETKVWWTKDGAGTGDDYWVKTKNGIKTDPMMLYMKTGALLTILTMLRLGRYENKRPSIYNLSKKSAVTELPGANWQAACRSARDLLRPWDDATQDAVLDQIEVTLARLDVYVGYVHNGLHEGVRIVQATDWDYLRKQIEELNGNLKESKIQAVAIETRSGKSVPTLIKEGVLEPPPGIPKEEYGTYDPSRIRWVEDLDGYIERAKDLRKRAVE
jgi:hypothetical protein